MRLRIFVYVISLFFLTSCHTVYHPATVRSSGYAVSGGTSSDTGFASYLKPYRDSMDNTMSEVLGTASKRMDVRRPASTLGNFMCDAMLDMAREKFDQGADLAVVNLGGIRRPYLEPGPVTRGMLFEIMPFDNLMVLVTVKGTVLEAFLQETAADGAGIGGFTMKVTNKKATEIRINGTLLDPSGEYTIVYSDYSLNNSRILKGSPAKQTNYLIRSAMEDYVKKMGRSGKQIGDNLENRFYAGN
jgi:2',3'-cyclic-nucleotide 2'-phosphodiesterase (5'-nucleotidase family)